ncbi:uncharacterized protein KQ657_001492 [Scheffersomyces spartinae]|uniref:Uncharacterized protein n=1 Tax=Scheffersomyces spartinae TaxID=45513 RepID=A0A9P7V7I9_9ASCO|nr:uncharacterized protein KQ657_001492 [Scheffersomyces spartinae]KAG7192709.1 hypothetical protein KQ657_001492 [Scheffersomyces spartinae]
MSDTEEFLEMEALDNPLRVIIVVQAEDVPDGDMEERMLDQIQLFEDMNQFFDTFDEQIAVPNESHIKYEVGLDGLVVIVVDTLELRDKALKFMDDYNSEITQPEREKENEGEKESSKKRKKNTD